MIYESNLASLRKIISDNNLDGLLLYSNRMDYRFSLWLAGIVCRSPGHYFWISKDSVQLFEISYHVADTASLNSDLEIISIPEENVYSEVLLSKLDKLKIGVAGPAPFLHLSKLAFPPVDCSAAVEDLLTIKDDASAEMIARSAQILFEIIRKVPSILKPGITEKDVEQFISGEFIRCGVEYAFPISILSGERLKHGTVGGATTKKIGENDLVLVDAGAIWSGYFSDCTRMFSLSENAPLLDVWNTLKTAQEKVILEISPSIKFSDITVIYKQQLRDLGLENFDFFEADLGHGIGYTLHEKPFYDTISTKTATVSEGMIFTLEPEIRHKDFLFRIEDMLHVSGNKVKVLTC